MVVSTQTSFLALPQVPTESLALGVPESTILHEDMSRTMSWMDPSVLNTILPLVPTESLGFSVPEATIFRNHAKGVLRMTPWMDPSVVKNMILSFENVIFV